MDQSVCDRDEGGALEQPQEPFRREERPGKPADGGRIGHDSASAAQGRLRAGLRQTILLEEVREAESERVTPYPEICKMKEGNNL